MVQTLVVEQSGKNEKPAFFVQDNMAFASCGQGVLRVVRFEIDGVAMNAQEFESKYGKTKFEFTGILHHRDTETQRKP